jgi:pentatricopeptide repeat protein
MLKTCRKARQPKRALPLLDDFDKFNVQPDDACLNVMLQICADCEDDVFGRKMLTLINNKQLPVNEKDYSLLIQIFSTKNQTQACLEVLDLMDKQKIKPDTLTYILLANACGNGGSLKDGRTVHKHIFKTNPRTSTPMTHKLQTTLLTMYAKCGSLEYAEPIFNDLMRNNPSSIDAVAFTAMMTAVII